MAGIPFSDLGTRLGRDRNIRHHPLASFIRPDSTRFTLRILTFLATKKGGVKSPFFLSPLSLPGELP
ncbi:hypothetical protein [Coleofasciculus sp.]|uniref:hypothetical protein n=1 Tax=Coleofasciculus sp. TaxID=3100458 RepID=UPI003A13D6F0